MTLVFGSFIDEKMPSWDCSMVTRALTAPPGALALVFSSTQVGGRALGFSSTTLKPCCLYWVMGSVAKSQHSLWA